MNSKRFFVTMTVIFAVVSIVALAIIVGCTKEGSESSSYKDGVYIGIGNGRNGEVEVAVTISRGKISKVEVTKHEETDGIADEAFKQIPDAIVKAQSVDVDAASGATLTSEAIKQGVAAALALASGQTASTTASKDSECDIIVIGAGGAGLAAATEAASRGAKVVVLEKMGITGGNTLSATGGLNAAETKFQKEKNISDSKSQYYEDTMKGGYNLNDPELVRNLTEKAPETVEWLISLGADLTDVGKMAGSTNSRTHRPQGGAAVGPHLAKVLAESAPKAGAEVRLNSKVTSIIAEGGKPVGVTVESPNGNYNLRAKAIIIATGGFGANPDMIVNYNPNLKGFGTTNHRGATGDAFAWVEQFDVALVDMDQIQTHPTVIPGNGIMITEAVRGNGAIMVNRDASRFGNEMATRDVMSADILAQKGQTAYLLFDQSVRESLKAIEGYVKQGLLTEAASLTELAQKLGMEPAVLEGTLAKYNSMQEKGNGDLDFKRKASEMPRKLVTGPFYAVEVGPAIHHTMGGIKINTKTEVITNSGTVVPGLFACGEVTGGVHGGNRLGGNAVADIAVYGKIAGDTACDYIGK